MQSIKRSIILLLLATFVLVPQTPPRMPLAFPVNLNDSIVSWFAEPVRTAFRDLPEHLQEEVRCLAQNIYFEARSEPLEGQIAVAHVTLNRTESPMFPQTICGVVKQTRKNVCQFSWWCDSRLRNAAINNHLANNDLYNSIKQLAISVVLTRHIRDDITKGALFYHANYVHRNRLGSMQLVRTTTIGQHVFYRM